MANITVFLRIYDMYLNEILFYKDKKIIDFLACSKYEFLLSKRMGKNNIDDINFFHHIVAKHSKNNYALDDILVYWEIIKPK